MDDCLECSSTDSGVLKGGYNAVNQQLSNPANVFNDFPSLAYLAQPPQSSIPARQAQISRQGLPANHSAHGSRSRMSGSFFGQQIGQLKPPPYVTALVQDGVPQKPKGIPCLWGACRDTFASQSDLIAHVNVAHLGVSPPPISVPQASPSIIQQQSTTQHLHTSCLTQQPTLACHWGDCGLSVSGQQSGNLTPNHHEFSSLSILANHLLQEHLGLPLPADIESLLGLGPASQQNGALLAVAPSLQVPKDSRPAGRDTSQLDTSPTLADSPTMMPTDLLPSPPRTASTLSPSSESTPTHQGPPSSSSGHPCLWTGCGRGFDNVDDLSKHVVDEHVGGGKGVYSCHWEGCDRHGSKAFSSKQKILRHLQTHTGHRPFVCLTCGQHFSEAATLQQHQRRHTAEKPYVCDHPGCGKSFAVAGALTIHKRTHSGVKPFKCTYCDRAFAESSNLSKHLRTHTGVKPYVCSEPGCGKRFCRPDQLNRHRAIHTRGSSTRKQSTAQPDESEDIPMYDDTSLGGYTADAVHIF